MDTLTTPAVASLYDTLFLNGGFTVMSRPDGTAYVPADGYAVSLTPTQHTLSAAAPFDAFADLVRSVTAPATPTPTAWVVGWPMA
jgi:hypothetical protein